MSFEPGLYTITSVDSSAPVCLGGPSLDDLPSETPLVVSGDDDLTPDSIRIEFAIAELESDGQYTMTINGSNDKVIVSQTSQGQAVVSQPGAEPGVWRFVPRGEDSNEVSYSIEIATEDPPVGWYYEGDPTTNMLVGPSPSYWKFEKVE